MKNILLSSLILLSFLSLSCVPPYRITSDFENGINFNAFHTYQILKDDDGFEVGANPINRQRIERAIVREMSRLDFLVQKNPDLLVSYFITEKTVRQIDYYHFYHGRWGYPGWGGVRDYQIGSLVIDLIDVRKKKVVWHGVASGGIRVDQPNQEEEINEVVQGLFNRFEVEANRERDMARIE